VFYALSQALGRRRDGTLAYAAALRCRELIQSGKKSLFPGAPVSDDLIALVEDRTARSVEGDYLSFIKKTYRERRAEAEEFQSRRTAYMMERLKAGRHPDTDPNFWDQWNDGGPPAVPNVLPYTAL